jgi:hypothetical protein
MLSSRLSDVFSAATTFSATFILDEVSGVLVSVTDLYTDDDQDVSVYSGVRKSRCSTSRLTLQRDREPARPSRRHHDRVY